MTTAAPTQPPAIRADLITIGTVATAHFTSHFLMLSLAPVLPLMRDDLGVTFTDLGLLLTGFYTASGIGQVFAGFLVDRFGARWLLLGGMTLQALAVLGMGLVPSYAGLIPLAILAGLGNTVYHPSDLTILSRRIRPSLLGRAYASHAIAGSVGFAASPVFVGTIAAGWGWRTALVATGLVGLAIVAAVLVNRGYLSAEQRHFDDDSHAPPPQPTPSWQELMRLPVFLAFLYFIFTSLAYEAIVNFGVAGLNVGYGATLALATFAVTGFQIGSVLGNFIGGYIVDRSGGYRTLAVLSLAGAALSILTAAWSALPLAAILAAFASCGLFLGINLPSRDILVRRAAPPGSLGKMFGMVYSGLDFGGLLAPFVYGRLLDNQAPELIFVASASFLAMAMLTIFGLRGRATD